MKSDSLTIDEVLQVLRNVGIDTDCGACMEIAFTGVTTNAHTCADARMRSVPAVIVTALCLLLVASTLHAQTLTNADLNKHFMHAPASADVYAALQAHAYHAPLTSSGPVSVATLSKEPNAGPWEFPIPREPRRLDGTLLSFPPQTYGAYPWRHYESFNQAVRGWQAESTIPRHTTHQQR